MSTKFGVTSYNFGHKIYLTNKEDDDGVMRDWRYVDTDEQVDNAKPRRCIKCNKYQTEEGHDPCMANIPGVKYACCGHGIRQAYITFEDGRTIRGDFKIE